MTASFAFAAACGAITLAASIQATASGIAVSRFLGARRAPGPVATPFPAVTVLKPLHGDEPLLEAALESFCAQDYRPLQIVFGVQRPDDPAIAVVERLRARFPDLALTLVIDATAHGANRKVDNLINMLPHALHDTLVISDADIHAGPDLLRRVVPPLSEPGVGLVTTLYTGLPADAAPWRLLGAAQINQTFLPGALLGRSLGREDCLGAVMAISRATLDAVGGLAALSPHLADDAELGRTVRATGRRVVLASAVPATSVTERSFGELFTHELRWGRTVRSQAPIGYPLTALQAPVGWALLALLAVPCAATVALVLASWALRVVTGRGIERRLLGRVLTPFWIAPLRDLLTLGVIVASHTGKEVAWRGQKLHTDPRQNLPPERPAIERRAIEGAAPIHRPVWRSAN